MGFPRQEYFSGLPFPSPRDLPNPGIKPESPALAGKFFTTEPAGKPQALGRGGEIGIWQSLEGYNGAALLHFAGPQGQKKWQTDRQTQISWCIPACPTPPEPLVQFLPADHSLQGTRSIIHLPNRPPSEKKICYKWSLWFFEVYSWNGLYSGHTWATHHLGALW